MPNTIYCEMRKRKKTAQKVKLKEMHIRSEERVQVKKEAKEDEEEETTA